MTLELMRSGTVLQPGLSADRSLAVAAPKEPLSKNIKIQQSEVIAQLQVSRKLVIITSRSSPSFSVALETGFGRRNDFISTLPTSAFCLSPAWREGERGRGRERERERERDTEREKEVRGRGLQR